LGAAAEVKAYRQKSGDKLWRVKKLNGQADDGIEAAMHLNLWLAKLSMKCQ